MCFHCGKTTVFRDVKPTAYYPLLLMCNGYCTECGKLSCKIDIVNLRLDYEPSDEENRYYLKMKWAKPYWERRPYEKGNCYKSSTTT